MLIYIVKYFYNLATADGETSKTKSETSLDAPLNSAQNTLNSSQVPASSDEDAKPNSPLEFLKGFIRMLFDWGVLILMNVLPGLLDDFRIIFGIICGVATAATLYQAIQFFCFDVGCPDGTELGSVSMARTHKKKINTKILEFMAKHLTIQISVRCKKFGLDISLKMSLMRSCG